jgi:hypothetical protein
MPVEAIETNETTKPLIHINIYVQFIEYMRNSVSIIPIENPQKRGVENGTYNKNVYTAYRVKQVMKYN